MLLFPSSSRRPSVWAASDSSKRIRALHHLHHRHHTGQAPSGSS
jgi:hypothetical protein